MRCRRRGLLALEVLQCGRRNAPSYQLGVIKGWFSTASSHSFRAPEIKISELDAPDPFPTRNTPHDEYKIHLLTESRHVADGVAVLVSTAEQVISAADDEPAGQYHYIVVHGQGRDRIGDGPGAEEHDEHQVGDG